MHPVRTSKQAAPLSISFVGDDESGWMWFTRSPAKLFYLRLETRRKQHAESVVVLDDKFALRQGETSMTSLMMPFRAIVLASAGAAFFMLAPAAANAEQCRQTTEHGRSVMMCGSVAYYGNATTATTDDSDDDDDEDEADDDGTLFVDAEDCEPGKFYMADFGGDEDVPVACH